MGIKKHGAFLSEVVRVRLDFGSTLDMPMAIGFVRGCPRCPGCFANYSENKFFTPLFMGVRPFFSFCSIYNYN